MKLNVVASAEILPPGKGEILTFIVPAGCQPLMKDTLGLIPHQIDQKSTTEEERVLFNLRVTGWDWRPEGLTRHQGKFFIWSSSTSQYPEEVEEAITKAGFKVKRITITKEQFSEMWKRMTPDPVATTLKAMQSNAAYHGRTRYLWKHNKDQFSAWEREFIMSMGKQLVTTKPLSAKQVQQLERLFEKYKVPHDATARMYGDDDLTTLRNISPEIQQFTQMDTEEGRHYQAARNVNNVGQAPRKYPEEVEAEKKKKAAPAKGKKTISEMKKDQKKKRKQIEKEKDALKIALEKQRAGTETVTSSGVPSANQPGDQVMFVLKDIRFEARVLAVSFMEGKVLYTLAVYTGKGFDSPEYKNLYGIVNSIGWDEQGRGYIRIPNIDSTMVESLPIVITQKA